MTSSRGPVAPRSSMAPRHAACRGFAWQRGSDLYLGVVIKVTLRLVPGALAELIEPRPIRAVAEPPLPSDLVPYRPHPELVVRTAFMRPSLHLRLERGHDVLVDKRAAAGEPGPFVALAEGDARRRAFAGSAPPRTLDGVLSFGADLDWRYFQCAPDDQRLAALSGDETLRLAGVHPALDVVTFTLPGVRASAFVAEEGSGAWRSLAVGCDLFVVDLHAYVAELSWRGAVRLDAELLRRLHVFGTVGEPSLPPVPATSSGLPAEPPAHLFGCELTSGTASMPEDRPGGVDAGAPFALPPPGRSSGGANLAHGTPWARVPAELPAEPPAHLFGVELTSGTIGMPEDHPVERDAGAPFEVHPPGPAAGAAARARMPGTPWAAAPEQASLSPEQAPLPPQHAPLSPQQAPLPPTPPRVPPPDAAPGEPAREQAPTPARWRERPAEPPPAEAPRPLPRPKPADVRASIYDKFGAGSLGKKP